MILNLKLFIMLFFFLLTLVHLIKGEVGWFKSNYEANSIPKFMIPTFQSHVVMVDRIQNMVTHYYEYFDKLKIKGKLTTVNENFNETLIYSQDLILKYRDNTCQEIQPVNDDTILSFWAKVENGYLIGPSAIIFLITFFKPNLKWDLLKNETIRGLPAFGQKAHFFDSSHDLNASLYYASHEWKKFYSQKLNIPLQMVIQGTIETKNGYQIIDQEYSYFSYHENNTWKNFEPILPIYGIGCSNVTSFKKFPENISQSFKAVSFNMEKIDKITQNSIWLKVYEDGFYGALRYDAFFGDFLIYSAIYDTKLKILYKFESYECKIDHLKNEIYSINELFEAEYYYLGEDVVQNIRVDVWERVEHVNNNKLVHTLFISQNQTLNSSLNSQKPIQVLHRTYSKDNEVFLDVEFKFHYFGPLLAIGTYQNLFSIEECLDYTEIKNYFKLIFNLNDEKMKNISMTHINLIKTHLTLMLAQQLNITPLRIPSLELEFKNNLIIAYILITQSPNPFWLFTYINTKSKIYASDYSKKVNTYAECAEIAIKQNSKVFRICHSYEKYAMYCVIPKNISKPISPLSRVFCKSYIANSENLYSLLGPTIEEITYNLINLTLAKNLKFAINFTNHDEQNVIHFSINNTIFEPTLNNPSLFNKEYALSLDGYKINSDGDFDTIIVENSQVHTIDDCYRACERSQESNCVSFSYCEISSKNRCILSGLLISHKNRTSLIDSKKVVEVKNETCYIFTFSFLSKYDVFERISAIAPYKKLLFNIESKEHCAELCYLADFPCKSFEYCDQNCYLRKERFIDFQNLTISATECSFYSVNYLSDYTYTGKTLIQNTFTMLKGISTADCAQACSETLKPNCISFNYCPQTAFEVSTCSLSTESPFKSKTKESNFCKNYFLVDTEFIQKKEHSKNIGMSGFNLFVLLIGMFNLGLIFGLISFIGYYKYQSRARSTSGMSSSPILRFTNNEEQNEEVYM